MTSTIHAAMGDTLTKVAIQVTDRMFELWDKAQIIVALPRTKIGKTSFLLETKKKPLNLL